MAKKELIPAKQEKAFERIKNFRGELADYRQTLDRLKRDREDNVCMPRHCAGVTNMSLYHSKPHKTAQSS